MNACFSATRLFDEEAPHFSPNFLGTVPVLRRLPPRRRRGRLSEVEHLLGFVASAVGNHLAEGRNSLRLNFVVLAAKYFH